MNSDRQAHWENVYKHKSPDALSWYQAVPGLSLDLIHRARLPRYAAIIDVGAGASVLVDRLLADGYEDLTILEISRHALEIDKKRLGSLAAKINWIQSDVTEFAAARRYALWHDRAVFHFLTNKADQKKYVQALCDALIPGGQVIIATFAKDGPSRCSGLDIVRYDEETMAAALGEKFQLVDSQYEAHLTPMGSEQKFLYCLFKKTDNS